MRNNRYENILKGMGSILDVMPAGQYKRTAQQTSVNGRLTAAWERVGENIKRSMDSYHVEPEKTSPKG